MALLRWLGFIPVDDDQRDADALADIERALSALSSDRARFLAAFAYLLGRVARADHEVSGSECEAMTRLVGEFGNLPADQADIAVRLATARGLRFGGTDDFLVSREFAKIATHEEKLALLEALFAVSASDQSILTSEDNEIHRIASEIQIGYDAFMAARRAYEQHLAARKANM